MKPGFNKIIQKLVSITGGANEQEALRLLVSRYRRHGETLESVATNLGVSAIVKEPLPFEGGLFYVVDGQRRLTVVKINSLSAEVRQRFTLAHEVGHLILSDVMGARGECKNNKQLEHACDAIAAECLMPCEEVLEFVREQGAPSTKKLKAIACRFDVSLETAARRVHTDLDLWRRPIGLWQYDGTLKERWFVGRRPWAMRTPPFAAFEYAMSSAEPIRTRESYWEGSTLRPIFLEVLHLGNQNLLGMVA